MGIFGKKGNALEKEMQKAEGEAISSIIDKSMSITGEISFQGKAMIDGLITGNITGDHLILSKSGKVNGDIKVSSFTCHGVLTGNIQATIATARKGCSIRGKLEAESLTVEPGALLEGEIKAAAQEHRLVETDIRQDDAQVPGKNKKSADS
jgi:cytoskeletal protein CcmA (bactofilin family)